MKKLVVGLIILLFVSSSADASTLYVDKSATTCSSPYDTDYNPGNRTCGSGGTDKVYKTIQDAADAVQAFNTVFIRGGTYNESIYFENENCVSNVTFKGYENEKVIIAPTVAKYGLLVGIRLNAYNPQNNLTFKNLEFSTGDVNFEITGFWGRQEDDGTPAFYSNITIDNCTFENIGTGIA